jgi:hypothetical protein
MKQFLRYLIAPIVMRKFESEAIREAYWLLDASNPTDMRLLSDKYRAMSIMAKEMYRRKEVM